MWFRFGLAAGERRTSWRHKTASLKRRLPLHRFAADLFLKGDIVKAIDKGDAEAVEQLEKQLLSYCKSLRAECEEKKEKVRNSGK
jgi:hypothetical protein